VTHGLSHCLGHKLINFEIFISKQGFFLCLFKENKLESKFVFNPIVEVVGYFNLKKNRIRKNVGTIEEKVRNFRSKSAKVEKEVCSSN
jgi:hypothetical protein